MRILVLGAGMLAHYLKPWKPYFASRSPKDWTHFHQLDIRDANKLEALMKDLRPDVVIDTVTSPSIPFCEREPALAEELNHTVHGKVARACNKFGAKMVFISTSSAFDGGKGMYTEEDETDPGTVYGQTKLRGEELVMKEANNWAIFRVTLLFGEYPEKEDFPRELIRVLGSGGEYDLWDQEVTLSYGPFVAEAMMKLIQADEGGIWHIAGDEHYSRYEIGKMIQGYLGKGVIRKGQMPEHLPKRRSMCPDKLKARFPELEFPKLENILRELALKYRV